MVSSESDKEEAVSGPNDPEYNPIFETLVGRVDEGQETIIGIVAYSLYKLAKREWFAEFRERTGRGPTDEEIRAYQKMWTPSLLEGKRSEAVQIIASFSQDVVEKARPAILEGIFRGNATRTVGLNIFSSFIYTLLVLGIVVVIVVTGWDIPALLQRLARLIQESH
jgi:hypothetical protein